MVGRPPGRFPLLKHSFTIHRTCFNAWNRLARPHNFRVYRQHYRNLEISRKSSKNIEIHCLGGGLSQRNSAVKSMGFHVFCSKNAFRSHQNIFPITKIHKTHRVMILQPPKSTESAGCVLKLPKSQKVYLAQSQVLTIPEPTVAVPGGLQTWSRCW